MNIGEELYAEVVAELRDISRNFDAATAGLASSYTDIREHPATADENAEIDALAGMQSTLVNVALRSLLRLVETEAGTQAGVLAGLAAIDAAEAGDWLWPPILYFAIDSIREQPPDAGDEERLGDA